MASSHESDITISSTIDTGNAVAISFSIPLFVVPLADNSLDGARVVTFTSKAMADDVFAAGDISEGTKDDLVLAFGQHNTIKKVKVAYFDTTTPETAAACLTAILAADSDWYAMTLQSKTDAHVEAFSAALEASGEKKILVAQLYDATFTASTPAPETWTGYAAIAARSRTALFAYGTDGTTVSLAYIAERLRFNLDTISPGWQTTLKNIPVDTTITKASQITALKNAYYNVGDRFGASAYFVKFGTLLNGLGIKTRITIDWFESKVSEYTTDFITTSAVAGGVLPCNESGLVAAQSFVQRAFDLGVTTGHFEAGQLSFPQDASSFNTSTKSITVVAEMQFVSEAQTINYYLNFSSDPVVTE